jgi:fructokinase
MRMRLGIDLGGTKIEIIALEDDGHAVLRKRIPSPRHSYQAIVQTVCNLVAEAEAELGKQGSVGVGIPGTISPATGLVKNANTTELIGKPFDKDLSCALGRKVIVANDANCFTLSEAEDGAAKGATVTFGVILGTGCGGALVVGGQILTGANSIGGEWGHNRLPDRTEEERPGPPCYCGKNGCVETFLSGPGFRADHKRATGLDLSPVEIHRQAVEGNPDCGATLSRYQQRLARGLAVVINIVDPDVIVLGGGLSNMETLYTAVPRLWSSYVFSDTVATKLIKAVHGDSSGVRGAAWLHR